MMVSLEEWLLSLSLLVTCSLPIMGDNGWILVEDAALDGMSDSVLVIVSENNEKNVLDFILLVNDRV